MEGRSDDDALSQQEARVGPPEPYAGIAESIIAKLVVDEADPRARGRRRVIHRLFVVANVIFAVGLLAIVYAMVSALVNSR